MSTYYVLLIRINYCWLVLNHTFLRSYTLSQFFNKILIDVFAFLQALLFVLRPCHRNPLGHTGNTRPLLSAPYSPNIGSHPSVSSTQFRDASRYRLGPGCKGVVWQSRRDLSSLNKRTIPLVAAFRFAEHVQTNCVCFLGQDRVIVGRVHTCWSKNKTWSLLPHFYKPSLGNSKQKKEHTGKGHVLYHK